QGGGVERVESPPPTADWGDRAGRRRRQGRLIPARLRVAGELAVWTRDLDRIHLQAAHPRPCPRRARRTRVSRFIRFPATHPPHSPLDKTRPPVVNSSP